MASIFLLLALCAVMAVASFLAGALPLSMSLSQSQLRLLSSVGVGILVGTSLIVIIPEGIEAAASSPSHIHKARSLAPRSQWWQAEPLQERDIVTHVSALSTPLGRESVLPDEQDVRIVLPRSTSSGLRSRANEDAPGRDDETDDTGLQQKEADTKPQEEAGHLEIPALEVGFSMILGFTLMFLIDRLPKHASDSFQSGPQPQHFSLDNLGGASVERASVDEEEGFLGSLAPTPKHTRTLATTVGLVIHAAADGIAMGASSATSSTKLGFIIFLAIMIHKAPAAFGLTSLLLRQGLSKRAARGHLVIFSLAAPAGAVSTWLLIKLLGGGDMHDGHDGGLWWTGMLLLFSGGTFLYVAMHAMQEDGSHSSDGSHTTTNGYLETPSSASSSAQRKPRGPEIRETLATVAGMFLPLLTQFGHH